MIVGGRTVYFSQHERGVQLACHACKTMHTLKGADPLDTDAVLDAKARELGWYVEDGGINGKCPECVNSTTGISASVNAQG